MARSTRVAINPRQPHRRAPIEMQFLPAVTRASLGLVSILVAKSRLGVRRCSPSRVRSSEHAEDLADLLAAMLGTASSAAESFRPGSPRVARD